jgi:mono/diheme cytochrome c family protein
MSEETDGGIFYKLSEGRMPMAAYKGKFSEEERWGLVNYIRTFAKKAPKKASAKK